MKTTPLQLLAAIFTSTVLCENTRFFSDTTDFTNFLKEEQIRVSHERADLVIEIDLSKIERNIRQPCLLAEATTKNSSTLLPQVTTQLRLLCKQERATWMNLLKLMTGVATEGARKARFIIATLVSSLAAGVAGAIWGQSHAVDQDRKLFHNQEQLVAALREEEHRGAITQGHVRELQAILSSDRERSDLRSEGLAGALVALAALSAQSHDSVRLARALESLLLQQKLSPGLLRAGKLREKLDHLRVEANAKGLRLGIDAVHQVFQLPVSFGTSTSQVLRVVVHLPLVHKTEIFQLFRFVPAPFTIKGSNISGLVSLSAGQRIAVSVDQSRWFEPTTRDLDGCLRLRGYRLCSSIGELRSAQYPSCLWGLWQGDAEMTKGQCRIRAAPTHAKSWMVGQNRYLVYQDKMELFRVECRDGRTASYRFQGLQQVRLDAGCQGQNEVLRIRASQTVLMEHAQTPGPPVALSKGEMEYFDRHLSLGQREQHRAAFRPVPLLHSAEGIRLEEPSSNQTHQWTLAAAGVTAVAVLVLLVAVLRARSQEGPHRRSISNGSEMRQLVSWQASPSETASGPRSSNSSALEPADARLTQLEDNPDEDSVTVLIGGR